MTTIRGPETIGGVVTDWLPLTTAGPPLSLCSSSLYFIPGESSRIVAFDPYYGKYIDTNVRCLASEASVWWNQYSTRDRPVNLGPFACPTGYTTAAISSMNEYTSFAGCCPSEYEYGGTLLPAATLGQCHSPLRSGQTFVAKKTFSGNIGSWVDTFVQVNTTGAQVFAAHLNGFVFRAESSTLPASTSASTTPAGTTPTSVSNIPLNTQVSGTSANAPTGIPTASNSPESGGLNSSAKIGIGIGVSLAVIGVMCLVFALILLRRRTRMHTNLDSANEIDTAVGNTNSEKGWIFSTKSMPIPHDRETHELSGLRNQGGPVEMPTHGG